VCEQHALIEQDIDSSAGGLLAILSKRHNFDNNAATARKEAAQDSVSDGRAKVVDKNDAEEEDYYSSRQILETIDKDLIRLPSYLFGPNINHILTSSDNGDTNNDKNNVNNNKLNSSKDCHHC